MTDKQDTHPSQSNGYKRGDVVQLNSGGHKMTIRDFRRDGAAAKCCWFDKSEYHDEWFMITTIKKA